MKKEVDFFCPVYEGEISDYDCDEISTGIHRGSFVSDGLPFLMDLETALSRRHSCHVCERCPERYRPRGGSALYALRHLGYPQGDVDEVDGIVMDAINRHASRHDQELQGRFSCCQLPSGVQLWYEWDPQMDLPVDVQPHFATANGMYMRIETLNKPRSRSSSSPNRARTRWAWSWPRRPIFPKLSRCPWSSPRPPKRYHVIPNPPSGNSRAGVFRLPRRAFVPTFVCTVRNSLVLTSKAKGKTLSKSGGYPYRKKWASGL